MLPSQMKYCWIKGLSRPRSSFSAATFSGVAKLPRMAVAGSPGISAMIANTMTEMPRSTGMAEISRRSM
jgi:hypothetical protein